MQTRTFLLTVQTRIFYHSSSTMARATRSSAKASTAEAKTYPYPKATPKKLMTSEANNTVKPQDTAAEAGPESEVEPVSKTKLKSKSEASSRTGKDSHLYTDDNPATTLHGTGFKDAATAQHTIELVQKRSLLYQFQTINTMYHRAKHHPHSSNNKDMQAAMTIFRKWLDETYPAARDSQIDFKPLLRRDVVEKYLPRMRSSELDTKWAEMYVALPKGKRLANVLMDDEKPGEADLARVRQDILEKLMNEQGDAGLPGKDDKALWDGDGVSSWHLKAMAYGWSPVKPDILLKNFETSERQKRKVIS